MRSVHLSLQDIVETLPYVFRPGTFPPPYFIKWLIVIKCGNISLNFWLTTETPVLVFHQPELFLKEVQADAAASHVPSWRRCWWFAEDCPRQQLARAIFSWGTSIFEMCWIFVVVLFPRKRFVISLSFAHGLVLSAGFPPSLSLNWDNSSGQNTLSDRMLMPQMFYMGVLRVRYWSEGAVACLWEVCPVYWVAGSPLGWIPCICQVFTSCICSSFRLVPARFTSPIGDKDSCMLGKPSVPNRNDQSHFPVLHHLGRFISCCCYRGKEANCSWKFHFWWHTQPHGLFLHFLFFDNLELLVRVRATSRDALISWHRCFM